MRETISFFGNVAGNTETANNFTLNGFDNNDASINTPNFRPSIDAIQEFNILTGVYSAQYGYASGGQVIVTTKSGGNRFHGSSYEFLRNQAIMAADSRFFDAVAATGAADVSPYEEYADDTFAETRS